MKRKGAEYIFDPEKDDLMDLVTRMGHLRAKIMAEKVRNAQSCRIGINEILTLLTLNSAV